MFRSVYIYSAMFNMKSVFMHCFTICTIPIVAHARDNGPADFSHFAFLPTCSTQNDDDDDDDDDDDVDGACRRRGFCLCAKHGLGGWVGGA